MSRLIFIFLLFVAAIIRGPLSILLIIGKNFSKPLKKRIEFERKNLLDLECRSFKLDLLVADYCFEVSSEGELEQVRPLIEFYLKTGKRIEILFASPSVESKCLKLAMDYKDQLRVMRLPIASFLPFTFLYFQSPWSWVTAPIIIFCRYDFFPELLSFKFLGKKLILVSAASKNPSWFKNQCHSIFNLIIAANENEAHYFKEHFSKIPVFSFDFRVPRIFERISKGKQTLAAVPELSSYLHFLDGLSPTQKFIMGSAWESDLVILKEFPFSTIHLLIVPHNLNAQSINELKAALSAQFPEQVLYEIKKGQEFDATIVKALPGIVILNLSGILCEIYSQFSFAYVGGGYERSIHSVLEPFLSGCEVFVGPRISRSTEYDFIKNIAPNEIHLLKNSESFYNLSVSNISCDRVQLSLRAETLMESIIKEIDLC